MRHRTLVPLVVAAMLILGGSAYALPIYSATLAHGGAYDVTWSDEINANLYTYYWEVTFNGIGTGYANERMTGFALFSMPDTLYSTGNPDTVTGVKGDTRTVNWVDPQLISRADSLYDVYWPAKHPGAVHQDPVFVGEKIGTFVTTFTQPGLSAEYLADVPSAIHVAWSEDDSEWINDTPEPISAILLALGLPVALAVRRRNGGSSKDG